MGKFSNWLDTVFGFEGKSNPKSLTHSLATTRLLQRPDSPIGPANPGGVQPYGLQGPDARAKVPPKPQHPKALQKLATRLVGNDIDIFQTLQKRAALKFAVTTNDDKATDIAARVVNAQPASNLAPTSLEELTVANQRLIPSAGNNAILSNSADILAGTNRRFLAIQREHEPANIQEVMQQASYSGNAPVVNTLNDTATIGDGIGGFPALSGDSSPLSVDRAPKIGGILGGSDTTLIDRSRGITRDSDSIDVDHYAD